jgi:hypothetical protein
LEGFPEEAERVVIALFVVGQNGLGDEDVRH